MENVFEDVQDVRRLKLEPGDILLVSVPVDTRVSAVQHITEQVQSKIPADVDILVVTGNIQMAVLTRGQATP